MSYRRGLGWIGYIKEPNAAIKHGYHKIMAQEPEIEIPNVKYGWIPFVLDQGEIGSCGPHAAITMMAATMIQNQHKDWVRLSPVALYYYVREVMGTIHSDSGVYNRVMLEVMRTRGAPAWHLWPYINDKWDVAPSAEANADAEKHQILEYHEITNFDETIHALATGRGLITGVPVFKSFEDINSSNNIITMPKPNEKILGGHDMYYFGYHLQDKLIYVLNSWGYGWGKNGVAAMTFEYFKKLASDTWMITLMEDSGIGNGR